MKALNLGEQLETYIACTSDETDPMEYIVVMEKNKADKKTGKIVETCAAVFVDVVTDSSTPNFKSNEDLIKTVECSIDSGDEELICK